MITNRKRKGQGATEYIIILVLVAIGSIAVITLFGDTIKELFTGSSNVLQGKDAGTDFKDAREAADEVNPVMPGE